MNSNKRLILSIIWVVIGIALLVLSIAGALDSTLYAGMGGALIAVGILQIIRNVRYRTDAAYREKWDTEVSDERNRFLRMKSWSWAGYIVVLIEAAGVIVAMVLGKHELSQVLSYSVCLILVAYLVSYAIVSRKY